MLFTVTQYLPINEDLAQKTDFLKKSGENEDGPENENETDSESSDNDGRNESSDFIYSYANFSINSFSQTIRHSYHSELNYRCSLNNIITPPPEA